MKSKLRLLAKQGSLLQAYVGCPVGKKGAEQGMAFQQLVKIMKESSCSQL